MNHYLWEEFISIKKWSWRKKEKIQTGKGVKIKMQVNENIVI